MSLTDPLAKFFTGPDTWRTITVRHLLTHTSGIPDYNDGQLDYRKDYTEDELVKFAATLPLDFTPGAEWKYSNTGYILLGALVRKVSGSFYGDVFARSRVHAARHDHGASHQRGRHRRHIAPPVTGSSAASCATSNGSLRR